MNLKQLLQDFTSGLQDIYEDEEVKAIFYLTAHHLLGLNRSGVTLNWDKVPSNEHQKAFREVVEQLKEGKAIQHLLGESFFYGLTFKVNSSVLIPRPETEELVDWILDTYKSNHTQLNVIDFGTGSGCIAISLKNNLPNAIVNAVEISESALETATENATLNGETINFIHADMLTYQSEDKFDVIVSNPPYITNAEIPDMHRNVLENEPHSALFVPDERPLLFYEAVADFGLKSLAKDGHVFFEINEYLSEETIQMLKDKSFNNIELRNDMQGKPRMIRASL